MSYRYLPPEGRPRKLYLELDHRFFGFLRGLPPAIRDFSHQRRVYLGQQSDSQIGGVQDLNPVLAGTPWLFWECFNALDDDQFLAVAEAGLYFVVASILLDHIIDHQADPLDKYILLQTAFNNAGIAIYREVFPSSSRFWSHFQRLTQDHFAGLSLEVQFQHHPEQIQLESLKHMAFGKVSPIVITLAGLSILLGRDELLEPLEWSLKHIAVASQLLDDIGDWEHDIQVRHYTYFLTSLGRLGLWSDPQAVEKKDIEKWIEVEWADVEGLRLVTQWLESSLDSVAGVACKDWRSYVENYKEVTEEHLREAMALHILNKVKQIL